MSTDVSQTVPAADATVEDPGAYLRWDLGFWEETSPPEVKALILLQHQINTLEGHYEMGKTALMIEVARLWIEAGNPVFHLDYEMGKRRVRERMKANLWTPDHLGLWHYSYMPSLAPGWLAERLAEIGRIEDTLVTVDSYSQAMMYLAREENSATEAGNFWVTELQGAREAGATILVIDQVKQNATSRDRYAGRGTGAKSFGSDVKWFVERFEKFTPTRVGSIKLTLQKDREGVLPSAMGFKVGDGEGHLTLTPIDPPKGTPIDEQAIEAVMQVIEVEGWQTASAIKMKTEGYGDATIRSTLQYMESKGQLVSRPRVGKGGGIEYNVPEESEPNPDVPSLD